ncbi:related to isoflavone reductase homolog P3 [Fusarium torulosum]|uniref:Related to isoflavone reductase homolog P3 n=1 Tax=Fusarium torulosum TaxID=33205 RepID=A0AAE8MAU8_9HYPO|nr:related to isoflavone reductase homolog P3 [Fusarium torulosum]
MTEKTNVVLVGASGETGKSVADGILAFPDRFNLTALARPASIDKPEYRELKNRGVKIAPVDVSSVSDELISLLSGVDVVITCLILTDMDAMKNIAIACQKAGVGRFIPSFWGPVCPPRGVMKIREEKENLLDFMKTVYLPYTIIDVGWWYQMSLPSLPSGKIDDRIVFPVTSIKGDGNTESALIDKRDIGKYVARIITDPRTLNKSVFIYNEIWTQNGLFDLLEKVSGEQIPRKYESGQELMATINDAKRRFAPDDPQLLVAIGLTEYYYSLDVRGDNTPEHAEYLGYLNGKELYPDVQVETLEDYMKGVVGGTVERVYIGRR